MHLADTGEHGRSTLIGLETNYSDLATRALQLYAFLSPLAYWRFGATTIGFADAFAPVAAVLLVWRGLRNFPSPYLWYVIYIGAACLSTFFSPIAPFSFGKLGLAFRLFALSAPFWLVFTIGDFTPGRIRRILMAALFGLYVAVAAGLILYALGIEIVDTQQDLYLGGGLGPTLRAGGLVGNSGSFGHITALFAMILFATNVTRPRPSTAITLSGIVGVFLAVIASSSRSGILMIVVFFLIVSWRYLNRKFVWVAWSVCGAALLTAGLFYSRLSGLAPAVAVSLARLDFLNLTGQDRFLETVRFATWASLFGRLGEVPILGYGYKSFENYIGFYVDNAYMLAYFETGLLGFLFFLLFWADLSLRLFLKSVRTSSTYALLALALCGAFLVRMMTGGANASWSAAPETFLLIALFWRASSIVVERPR